MRFSDHMFSNHFVHRVFGEVCKAPGNVGRHLIHRVHSQPFARPTCSLDPHVPLKPPIVQSSIRRTFSPCCKPNLFASSFVFKSQWLSNHVQPFSNSSCSLLPNLLAPECHQVILPPVCKCHGSPLLQASSQCPYHGQVS